VGSLLSPPVAASPVVVTNSRGVHSQTIAEHAIALMLALRRDLHLAVRRQSAQVWAQQEIYDRSGPPIRGATLLVVGAGTIGARVAALGIGLGMVVTIVRRRVDQPSPPGVQAVFPLGRLTAALAGADVVVLAVPHTRGTGRLIGAAELAAMKRSALLINVARGELVDEPALVRALQDRQIAGAGLDAFDAEPLPPDHPLWTLPNVLISPHTATFSGDYWSPIVDLFLENVARFTRGDDLLNVVDKEAGY
jgi:phosphoglycerate dehydrogenase-like enzyme